MLETANFVKLNTNLNSFNRFNPDTPQLIDEPLAVVDAASVGRCTGCCFVERTDCYCLHCCTDRSAGCTGWPAGCTAGCSSSSGSTLAACTACSQSSCPAAVLGSTSAGPHTPRRWRLR